MIYFQVPTTFNFDNKVGKAFNSDNKVGRAFNSDNKVGRGLTHKHLPLWLKFILQNIFYVVLTLVS